jgi:alkanesulfonate monooxygenase SsuD/methylene tetrahydromethanopterin reductase-like flavin-dependent oxidoreductase (luciferase family)
MNLPKNVRVVIAGRGQRFRFPRRWRGWYDMTNAISRLGEFPVTVKLGYLLPTREAIMQGHPEVRPMLDAAKQAGDLGFDSIWVGDSLFARPRHDPITLLAAVGAAVPDVELGTAVLLSALRNPVVLAQQLATVDQISEGGLIIGAGIAADVPSVRAEFTAAGVPFEGRVGRMMEGFELCRALWTGEPVSWDGRWQLEERVLAPVPYRPEGPPIWLAAGVPAGIERAAKHYDGWFPIGPDAKTFAERQSHLLQAAETAGREADDLTTAMYLTVAVMDDPATAETAINAYLEDYYGAPAKVMRQIQACRGGNIADVIAFIQSYVAAGAEHLVIRIVGEHGPTLEALAEHRADLVL